MARFDGAGGKTIQNSAVTVDDSGNMSGVGTINGVKRYVALLSQSGTSAPTVTVLENSLGGTVVWTRFDVGVYTGTLSGVFMASKTAIFPATRSGIVTTGYRFDANSVAVETYSVVEGGNFDDALNETAIEIRVYP
ncbi:MAG TPA: hypothetical protein VN256_13270 [Pyrinomonadaceae bacterium]|nr:hypothetical protein [Pyrinomonadaceae bacterium]